MSNQNRKPKPFLRGVGVGFIAGAVLLQLMIAVQENKPGGTLPNSSPATTAAPSPGTWNKETVKKQGEALGLKIFEPDAKVYTEEQLNAAVEKAKKEAQAAASQGAPQDAAGDHLVTVYIYEGMPASSVVEYLYQAGIVVDRMAFQTSLTANGLSVKLRSGLYNFHLNEDPDVVIKELTTIPKT